MGILKIIFGYAIIILLTILVTLVAGGPANGIERTECIELFFGDNSTTGIILDMAGECWELLK